MPNNSIRMNANQPFVGHQNSIVTRIRLRGSWVASQHQELMLTLNSGVLVRISRNNGDDTFQIGANEDGNFVMNTLVETVIPDNGPTVRLALQAFGDVHRQWPRYEQADCQLFAQETYRQIYPNVQGLPEEEDIM